MDSDEEKKQSESFISKSKEKMQKIKKKFKIFMKLSTPVKIAIIVIPLVVIILLVIFLPGLAFLMDILGSENVLNAKASAMESMGTDSNTYSSEVIKLEDGSWNLSMSDTIKDKLTENGIDISGKDENELLLEVLKLYGLDDEYLSKDEMNLLPYLIKAEIATQQLDLRSADEMYNSDGTYNPPNTDDMENSTKIYGTVHLKRVNSKDKSTTYLSYVDYETFKSYSNNKDEAIKYFSFNDSGSAVIYTWNHTKYTYNNQKGEIEVPDSAKKENVDQVNLQETVISDYQALIKKYTLPFEVLTALLINSEDINFTKEVADLAFKANIEISLIEEYEYTKTTNTTKYYQTTRGYQHLDGHITLNGESVYNHTGLIINYTDNENIGVICNHTGNKKHENKYTYFKNDYTNSNPSYTIVETIEQETNTYKYGVTLADCWFVKVEKKIKYENEVPDEITSEGERTQNQYTFLREFETNGENAVNIIKKDDLKDQILNGITNKTNSIKNGISVPRVTFDFGNLSGPKVNVTHNVKIKSVQVYQPAAVMQGGVFTSYPNSATASVTILGRSIVETTPGTSPIYPIEKIVIKDINNNTFEFDGTGDVKSKDINVNKQYNVTLQTYEYIKTDEQTTAVANTTKYPITDGETTKDLYDNKDEKFLKAYGENGKARGNIGSTPGWMEEMIDEYNPEFTTIMTYLLDMYKYGKSDVDINSVLNLFDTNSFKSINGSYEGSSLSQFKRWLRKWELHEGINETGTLYKVGLVGGNRTVGYGVDLETSGALKRIKELDPSIDTSNIKAGDWLPVSIIDQIEEEEIQSHLVTMKEKTKGLDLTEYQLYAMVSRAYNCGDAGATWGNYSIDGKDFEEAFKAYWKEDDYKLGQTVKDAIYDHNLYKKYMQYPTTGSGCDLIPRRKAEWQLFTTGYYDKINEYYCGGYTGDASGFAATFLNKADEIYKYMVSNGYHYGFDGNKPSDSRNIRLTCCAAYVSWTLYESGWTEIDNLSGWRGCAYLSEWCEARFQKITSFDSLQPGDIIFGWLTDSGGYGHVTIYAGDFDGLDCYYDGGTNYTEGMCPGSKFVINNGYGVRSYVLPCKKVKRY